MARAQTRMRDAVWCGQPRAGSSVARWRSTWWLIASMSASLARGIKRKGIVPPECTSQAQGAAGPMTE